MLFFFFFDAIKNLGDIAEPVKMNQLFQIQTGIIEEPGIEYYTDNQTDEKKKVRILRMSSFDYLKRQLKPIEYLNEADKRLNQLREIRSKKEELGLSKPKTQSRQLKEGGEKKFLPESKLIENQDYIINTKGVAEMPITGYSMLKSITAANKESLGPISATHHFIILKPSKLIADKFDTHFLHVVLDAFIETHLSNRKDLLSTKVLKDLTLVLPSKKSTQEFIYAEYQALQDQLKEKYEAIHSFQKELGQSAFKSV